MDYYNQVCTHVLFSDIALAFTFIGMAENRTDKTSSARLLDRAWHVHDEISRIRHSIEMSPDEQDSLDFRLNQLSCVLRKSRSPNAEQPPRH